MHHKFFLFSRNKDDKPVLVTGSYNPTGRAECGNWENVVVTDDREVIIAYKDHLKDLLKDLVAIPENALEHQEGVTSFTADINCIPEDKRHAK
jgi:phosphatidylserine/phosphatidylglycerophosphate/cardiolipin synthase-like enzyme